MLTLFGILKGLLIQQESDRTKEFTLEVDPSASTDTRTTLKSKQTDDRVLELPDTSGELVEKDFAQILTQKEIDADLNTILNIEDENIKAGAAIDATKIADGSVDNTEFQALDGVESNIQGQLDNKAELSAALVDNTLIKADGIDSVQSTGIIVDDLNNISGVETLSVSGIDNNNTKIINVANPTNPQDVATKDYVDNASPGGGANTSLTNLIAPVEPNQDFNFQNTNKITGLPVPTLGSDAANKDYVDSIVGGANTNLSNLVAPVQPNENFDFQGVNTITGIPTPVNPSDVVNKDYVDNIPTTGRIITGSFNTPEVVGGGTAIPTTASSSDEDIYIEGNGNTVTFTETSVDSSILDLYTLGIEYSDLLKRYVTVMQEGSGAGELQIYVSSNGIDWEDAGIDGPDPGSISAFNTTFGKNTFMFTFVDGSFGGVGISQNGYNWNFYEIANNFQGRALVYSEDQELFVSCGSPSQVYTSPDGISWTNTGSIGGGIALVDNLAYGNGRYVSTRISGGNTIIATSTDAITWNDDETLSSFSADKLIFSKELGLFVVTDFFSDTYYTSPDGLIWTARTFPSSLQPRAIAYSEEQKIFMAFTNTNLIYTSVDGISWTNTGFAALTGTYLRLQYKNHEFYASGNGTANINIAYTPYTFNNISVNPQIVAGTSEGKRLTVIGSNSANAVTLVDGNGIKLKEPSLRLGENDIVQFRWNSDSNLWVDISSINQVSSTDIPVVSGANSDLSNLTSPTAVNQSLIPGSALLDLGGIDDPWANVFANNINNVNGDNLHINGNDAFAIQIGTFADGVFGVAGGIDIRTGSAQNSIGDIQIIGGNSVDSNGGNITISSGDSTNANAGGVDIGTGSSSSGNPGRVKILNNALFTLSTLSADPAGAEVGAIYFNTSSNKFRGFDGSIWTDLN